MLLTLFTSSSVESGSSDPSSSGVEEAPKKSQARQTPFESYDEAEVGTYRSTWHILARVAPTAKPDLPLIGTVCGRKFPQELFFVQNQFELMPGQSICTHPGCRKGWKAIGVLD